MRMIKRNGIGLLGDYDHGILCVECIAWGETLPLGISNIHIAPKGSFLPLEGPTSLGGSHNIKGRSHAFLFCFFKKKFVFLLFF